MFGVDVREDIDYHVKAIRGIKLNDQVSESQKEAKKLGLL